MEQFFLGADISKGYADFVILDSKKQVVKENFQLDDTVIGHNCLYGQVSDFIKNHPDAELFAAVESTGGYENNWYNSLLKFQGSLKIQTTRLNPEGVCCNSKADLKRVITDKVSAQSIAEYLIAHPEKVIYQQEDYWASLRKQWSFIQMLTKQNTQLLNQLETLVYSANSEILQYCNEGVPGWVLKLLKKYPTAKKLAKARVSSLIKIPYLRKDRAKELIEGAKNSISSVADSVSDQLISATVSQILHIKDTIKSQTEMMVSECDIPEVEILKTFNGIGLSSAVGLMLEIQTIDRFPSVKKLASFFGIHPVFKASGDGLSGFRMSKKGRKEPRRILFMVALSAVNSNPLIRDLYEGKIANGMERMAAIGVCMHKILRIIYGMLKNKAAFDPAIDKKNQERVAQKTETTVTDKCRRIQEFDAKAPISGRQKKKRKERILSQSASIDALSGIKTSVQESSS